MLRAIDVLQTVRGMQNATDFDLWVEDHLVAQLFSVLEKDPAVFLDLVFHLVHSLTMDVDTKFDKLYLPQIDQLLTLAAAKISKDLNLNYQPGRRNKKIMIGSEFYREGGHNTIAKQILMESSSCELIITDCFHSYQTNKNYAVIFENFENRTHIIKDLNYREKVISIVDFLIKERPVKVILNSHPQDPIPIVVALILNPFIQFDFIHHADHSPCIGLTLNIFNEHLDFFDHQARFCIDHGISNVALQRFHPNYKLDVGIKERTSSRRLLIVGNHSKFDGNGFSLYLDVIKALISRYDVFHVGYLPPVVLGNLADSEFISKYKYIGPVDDLDDFIETHNFDLFINSFPIIGGLSCLHAMSKGMPTLTYFDPLGKALQFIAIDGLVPPDSLVWRTVEELLFCLDAIFSEYDIFSEISQKHFKRLQKAGCNDCF